LPLRTIHNTFTRGELDPSLFARVDIDIYTKGARKMRNTIGLWTGACSLAPATIFIDMLVDRTNGNAPITDHTLINGVDFQYSFEDNIVYTLIFRPDTTSTVAIDIYFEEALVATVPANMYTTAQIKQLHFAVGQDRVLILHPGLPTRQIIRGATSAIWNLTTFTPTTFPVYDFTVIGGTQYRVPGFTFLPGATTGATTLTASSAIFTANHIGGLYVGGGGTARIVGVTSSTVADIKILTDFISAVLIEGNLSSLSEVMWTSGGGTLPAPPGANHGWPSRGVFFLDRLILGNSPPLKNAAALSVRGVFDNFDDSTNDASAGFSVLFNGKGNQTIQSMIADDSIVFLTSNKVFAQNPLVDAPISVSTFYFAPQSQDPASDIEGVTLDNQILHISGNYSQVMQVIYSTADAKYLSTPVGLLSAQLFQTLTTNATWEPKNIKARLYFATQENGTMLIYNTLAAENVSSWSLRNTRGKFRRAIGDGLQTHVVVERQVTLGTSYANNIEFAYLTNNLFTAFYDVTQRFSDPLNNVALFENQNDYILFGNTIPFTRLNITLAIPASLTVVPQFEYLDGNGSWNTFVPTDNTNGFVNSGLVIWTFDDVLDWAPNKAANNDETYYWIRIRRTAATLTVLPVESTMLINTGNRLFLEKLTFDNYTDSTITTSSNVTGDVTGLTNLAGQQVYAIADGATYGPFFVSPAGTVNIVHQYSEVAIGLQYKPLLIPMPIFTPTQEGDNVYVEKYVQDLYLDYVDSLYLQVGTNDGLTDVPALPLGAYTMGTSMPPQTGVHLIHPRGSWEPRQEIVITQSLPGPMTVIGIGYTVELT